MNLGVIKGTASLEVKSSKRNRELENFASLEPRVCEVLLYLLNSKVYQHKFLLIVVQCSQPNQREKLPWINKRATRLFGTSEYCPTEHGAESLLDTYWILRYEPEICNKNSKTQFAQSTVMFENFNWLYSKPFGWKLDKIDMFYEFSGPWSFYLDGLFPPKISMEMEFDKIKLKISYVIKDLGHLCTAFKIYITISIFTSVCPYVLFGILQILLLYHVH